MIAVHSHPLASPATQAGSLLDNWKHRLAALNTAASDRIRQTLCGAQGHSMLLHFEANRLSLECMSCGRTTPGWTIRDRR